MKVVIVYDTKRGSTKQIVDWMVEELKSIGIEVSSMRPNEVDTLDCDLIVVGSLIYWEKPLKSITDFLRANQDVLREKNMAVFVVCMAQIFGKHTDRYIERRYVGTLKKVSSGKIIETCAFRGWLTRVDYNQREKIKNWIRRVVGTLNPNA
ncbi:MAG TPA: hypothetical protein ENG74_01290 [Thermoplasmatales archaeon]|nr:hypothetical protein [Thermoplasmatales archaeon]